MTGPLADDVVVEARQTIAAPRERVFAAFTEADQIRQWWGPGDFTCPEAEVDLRPGGAYRLLMRSPEGEMMAVAGTYQTVEAPHLLVYSWRWEGPMAAVEPESLVTVEFRDADGDTEVVVTHSRLAASHDTSGYNHGWVSGLEKLDRLLSRSAGPGA